MKRSHWAVWVIYCRDGLETGRPRYSIDFARSDTPTTCVVLLKNRTLSLLYLEERPCQQQR